MMKLCGGLLSTASRAFALARRGPRLSLFDPKACRGHLYVCLSFYQSKQLTMAARLRWSTEQAIRKHINHPRYRLPHVAGS